MPIEEHLHYHKVMVTALRLVFTLVHPYTCVHESSYILEFMTKGGGAGSLFSFQNDAKLQCWEAALTRVPKTAVIRVSLPVSQLPFIFTNPISGGCGGDRWHHIVLPDFLFTSWGCACSNIATSASSFVNYRFISLTHFFFYYDIYLCKCCIRLFLIYWKIFLEHLLCVLCTALCRETVVSKKTGLLPSI